MSDASEEGVYPDDFLTVLIFFPQLTCSVTINGMSSTLWAAIYPRRRSTSASRVAVRRKRFSMGVCLSRVALSAPEVARLPFSEQWRRPRGIGKYGTGTFPECRKGRM